MDRYGTVPLPSTAPCRYTHPRWMNLWWSFTLRTEEWKTIKDWGRARSGVNELGTLHTWADGLWLKRALDLLQFLVASCDHAVPPALSGVTFLYEAPRGRKKMGQGSSMLAPPVVIIQFCFVLLVRSIPYIVSLTIVFSTKYSYNVYNCVTWI